MSETNEQAQIDLASRAARYGTFSKRATVEELGAYETKLAGMDDEALELETSSIILMSARCDNNPRAIWHWQADACYTACEARKESDPYLYRRAYNSAVSSQGIAIRDPVPARPKAETVVVNGKVSPSPAPSP